MKCPESAGKPSDQWSWCENLAVRAAPTLLSAFQLLPQVQRMRSGKKAGLSSPGNVKVSMCPYSLLQVAGM